MSENTKPLQPRDGLPFEFTRGQDYRFPTVVSIGSKFLNPHVLHYNDHTEQHGLEAMIESYTARPEITPTILTVVVDMLTNSWQFRKELDEHVSQEARTTEDGLFVSLFVTADPANLPDGKPKPPRILPEGTYEIWVEGHVRSYGAVKLGEGQGETFKDACIAFFEGNPEFNAEKMWYAWGHLFDNETDARKNYF